MKKKNYTGLAFFEKKWSNRHICFKLKSMQYIFIIMYKKCENEFFKIIEYTCQKGTCVSGSWNTPTSRILDFHIRYWKLIIKTYNFISPAFRKLERKIIKRRNILEQYLKTIFHVTKEWKNSNSHVHQIYINRNNKNWNLSNIMFKHKIDNKIRGK